MSSISDYAFDLPEELIAQEPLPARSASRMLAISRDKGDLYDLRFEDFPSLLANGDVLVMNNTRVFPARVYGQTETGANVEIFFSNEIGRNEWEALARPAKRLKPGRVITFPGDFTATVAEVLESGRVRLKLNVDQDVFELLESVGKTPLPPYIKREPSINDRTRYQTVYARNRGAIAAPTAGLHFTPEIIEKIKNRGVRTVEITLHVGYGTFEPVRVNDLSTHAVSAEAVAISGDAADILNSARKTGRRIIAVGTTTTRALEWNVSKYGRFRATVGIESADLTITPGYQFKAIDALLTNFHLPKSSLLVLVSTFAGRELIMKAYEHAVAEKYRFYSYGDCMFIS